MGRPGAGPIVPWARTAAHPVTGAALRSASLRDRPAAVGLADDWDAVEVEVHPAHRADLADAQAGAEGVMVRREGIEPPTRWLGVA